MDDRTARFLLEHNDALEYENQTLRRRILKLYAREVWLVLITGAICVPFGAWMALYLR